MGAAESYAAQLGIDASNPVTKRYDFMSSGLGADEEFLKTDGLRGTRSRFIERVRGGRIRCQGEITLSPTPVELAALLPWILGGSASGTDYPLADVLPVRYVTVDKVTKVYTYDGCKVGRCVIHGSEGTPLEVRLSVVGLTETEANAATFPSLTLDSTTSPFVYTDCAGALSVNSTTTQSKSIEITIDNMLDTERFFNSRTLTAIPERDREITLALDPPIGDSVTLYNLGSGGVPVTVTFTNGAVSWAMSFVKVVFPRKPTAVPGRNEIMLRLVGECKKSGSTMEMVTTLDSTL